MALMICRMVNNAGISIESRQKPARIHETSQETWNVTMAVNTTSVFLGCKYATAQMLKQEPHENGDRGWIINLSSIFGLVGGYTNGELLRPCRVYVTNGADL